MYMAPIESNATTSGTQVTKARFARGALVLAVGAPLLAFHVVLYVVRSFARKSLAFVRACAA